jgi:cytochrome c553
MRRLHRCLVALWLGCSVAVVVRAAEPSKPEPSKAEPAVAPSAAAADSASKPAAGDDAAGDEFFERKIRPLLAQHCFSCHGRGQKKGGLSLDSREGILAGGDSGTAAVLGKPDESLLIEAVEYDGDVQMPPDKKLSDDEIAALRQWLSIGAPWPAAPAGNAVARNAAGVSESDRQFWSFQPIADPPAPEVKQTAWPRHALDRFVLARLEADGLRPAADADRRTFIRRVYFDLLGLPPTAEAIDAFVADERSDAYERIVDELLASPHYGERQARHWLDLARYGEDQAHTFAARLYPNGFRYRDWVVGAFNRDLPYDRFVVEQIAGDLIDEKAGEGGTGPDGATNAEVEKRKERLPALGFMALGPVYYADAGCAGKAKTDEYDDRIDTLCRSLLGLTVSCARCHDHKFDPIPTADYYALAGVFASTEYFEAPLVADEVVKRYDAAQARVKDAEQQLRDGQTLEARRLGESYAARTADYLMAVAKYEQRKKTEPGFSVDAAAKGAGLDALVLERWRQRLEADRTGKIPLLADWRAVENAGEAERRKAAEALQAKLVAAIDKRSEAEAKSKRPTLDGPTADVLKTLVDDRSAPLAMPRIRSTSGCRPIVRNTWRNCRRGSTRRRRPSVPSMPSPTAWPMERRRT